MTGREGRLSWEARAEEVSFEVLPKRCNRGTISYMERERVPQGRGIVTEGIRKVFNCHRMWPQYLQKMVLVMPSFYFYQ